MTFIVILIALLVERFFDWSHLRNWSWFLKLQSLAAKQFPNFSPYLIIAITVIPLLALILIINYFLMGMLYGFISLLFNLFILIYCLGPQNLWADAFSSINQLEQNDVQLGSDKLSHTFGITESQTIQAMHQQFLDRLFVEGHSRVFAIIFWFLILGTMGAVLYRAVAVAHDSLESKKQTLGLASQQLRGGLDWLPVRIYTFLFALGGHFVQVLTVWRTYLLQGISTNTLMMIACGHAALGLNNHSKVSAEDEKQALSLLDRVFIITLVLIALGSFVFW